MTLIKVDEPIGTRVVIRNMSTNVRVAGRVGTDGVVRELGVTNAGFEKGPYELMSVSEPDEVKLCPMCERETNAKDLKEYDPGKPVCWVCRSELGRMDYYSGAGDW